MCFKAVFQCVTSLKLYIIQYVHITCAYLITTNQGGIFLDYAYKSKNKTLLILKMENDGIGLPDFSVTVKITDFQIINKGNEKEVFKRILTSIKLVTHLFLITLASQ